MDPRTLSASLRHIAATLDNSKNPSRELVARDIHGLIVRLSSTTNFLVTVGEGYDGYPVIVRYNITARNMDEAVKVVQKKESGRGELGRPEYRDIDRKEIQIYGDPGYKITIQDLDHQDKMYRAMKKDFEPPCGNGQCDGMCSICLAEDESSHI